VKICQIIEKRGNTRKKQAILLKIPLLDKAYQRTLLIPNCGISLFFRRNIFDACLFVEVFFFRSDCIKPKVQDNLEGAHSNGNLKLVLSDHRD